MEAVLNVPVFPEWIWARRDNPFATQTTTPASEADLVRAARGGDRAAFGKLVQLHKRAVFGVAYRLLGADEAADASQEAFLRAYQRLASFDPSLPLRPWLVTIARHYCVDQLRAKGRQPPTSAMDSADDVASENPRPEEQIELREQSDRVTAALESLPTNHREALMLFHQDQLSYRDIAQALGVPIGTVMTWIHRARRTLRTQLEASA